MISPLTNEPERLKLKYEGRRRVGEAEKRPPCETFRVVYQYLAPSQVKPAVSTVSTGIGILCSTLGAEEKVWSVSTGGIASTGINWFRPSVRLHKLLLGAALV